MKSFIRRIGKIDIDKSKRVHLPDVDKTLENTDIKQKEIAARLRLLEIQGTPRGGFDGIR